MTLYALIALLFVQMSAPWWCWAIMGIDVAARVFLAISEIAAQRIRRSNFND